MSLLLAALELCLLLHQNHEEFAFAGRCAGVVLQLDQLNEHCKPLIEGLIVESLVRQVKDDVEKEVISGLEGLLDEMIEAEFAGKERPVLPPLEVQTSVEVWILPDGQARCRFVTDVFGDDAPNWHAELRKDFEDAFITSNKETPDQIVEVDETRSVIEQTKLELHDHHMRSMITLFYDDVNGAEVFAVGKVKFAGTTEGFEFKAANSIFDAIGEFGVGDRGSLTLILPGDVLETPPGSTVNGRTVTWRFDDKTWTEQDTKVAQLKPRKIRCGPSLIDDREMAAFVSERDGLKAQIAKSRKPPGSDKKKLE